MTEGPQVSEVRGPAIVALLQSVSNLISEAMARGMDTEVVLATVAVCAADHIRVLGGSLEALCATIMLRAEGPLPQHRIIRLQSPRGSA